MCTAISYCGKDHYFGRNLDYEHSFAEKIVITSRDFLLSMRHEKEIYTRYAIIGMGIVSKNFPLYFDATNEVGLSAAGLLFPHFSHYHPVKQGAVNIASFEFIPFVLSQCKSVCEAKELIGNINISDSDFDSEFPSTPLHWIITDKNESITVESVSEGVRIYDNPVGVLTNSPPFPSQMHNLGNYASLSPVAPRESFGGKIDVPHYSRGLGAVGLPGDLSSMSRFVRAVYTKTNSPSYENEKDCVSQIFHILGSVYQTSGSVITKEGALEKTQYSSCVNTDKGIYYYTTYGNSSVNAVDLHDRDIDTGMLYTFDLARNLRVNFQT